MVLYHEKIHQFLVPKLSLFRSVRVEMRTGSYANSSLFRYLEETLAETVAQVRVNGWQKLFCSFKFPTNKGYVYWVKCGSRTGPGFAIGHSASGWGSYFVARDD